MALHNDSLPTYQARVYSCNLTHELFPYQKEAIEKMCGFLRTNPARATYNACEPGLGKTRMTGETAKVMKFKKLLIVCPAVVRLTWKRELNDWFYPFWKNILPILSLKDINKISSVIDVCIISYDLLSKDDAYESLLKHEWDCLILDEAHYLKSEKSQRTKICLHKVWPHIPYRIALSGTPFLSSIMDVHPVFDKMLPETFGNYYQFGNKFSNKEVTPWGVTFKGIQNPKLLSSLINKHFFLRYKKQDVLPDLPTKIYQKIILPKSTSVKVYEEEMLKLLKNPDGSLDFSKLEHVSTHLAGIRKLQGLLKVNLISEYVKDLLEQEIPVVMFTYHQDVIKEYAKKLLAYGPVIVEGSTSASKRQKAIEYFQKKKSLLFIGQIQASGIGISLTASSQAIIAELPWSPSELVQAVDRLARIGQKNTVNIHYFVVENSIDEHIANVIVTKAKAFSKILN